MEEIINSPDYQQLLPYVPYIQFAFFVRIALEIFLCIISRQTLLLIKEENRCMHVNHVWFIFIPLFCIYWNFVFMRRMTDSLNNEFYDRKIAVEENPSQRSGYFFAGTYLVYYLPVPSFIKFVSYVLGIVTLILYIFKIKEYKNLLEDGTLGSEDQF